MKLLLSLEVVVHARPALLCWPVSDTKPRKRWELKGVTHIAFSEATRSTKGREHLKSRTEGNYQKLWFPFRQSILEMDDTILT